jgi:hypothetical protein
LVWIIQVRLETFSESLAFFNEQIQDGGEQNGGKRKVHYILDIFQVAGSKFHTLMQKHKWNWMEHHVLSLNGQIQNGS